MSNDFSLIGQADPWLDKFLDFYREFFSAYAKEIERYAHVLLLYTEITPRSFKRIKKKANRYLLDLITHYAHNPIYRDKPYQIIRDYNGLLKVTAREHAPIKWGKRNRDSFKSYNGKLPNSISRTRNTVVELAICNDWKYFVTFTIDKARYDRYNLSAYIKAFTKWLSNYSVRKTDGVKIGYLLMPELHKDGAWHLHGLMNGIPAEHLCSTKDGCFSWMAYEEKFGHCSLEPVRSKEAVAWYSTKHLTKLSVVRKYAKLNSRLYYCSKELKRSEIVASGYNLIDIDGYDFENEYLGGKWL